MTISFCSELQSKSRRVEPDLGTGLAMYVFPPWRPGIPPYFFQVAIFLSKTGLSTNSQCNYPKDCDQIKLYIHFYFTYRHERQCLHAYS
jgi:hypothetical protein